MRGSGIEFTEIVIANDGISVVVNPENDWIESITVEQLKTEWASESDGVVTNWSQVDPSFPDEPLALFGPGPTPARSTASAMRSTAKRGRAAPTTVDPRTTT